MIEFFRSMIGKVVPGSFLQGSFRIKRLYYGHIPNTQLGVIWLAVSREGVAAVDFDKTENEFVKTTEKFTHGTMEKSDDLTREIREKVRSYLAGELSRIDYPVDLDAVSAFQRKVLSAVREITRGATATYSDVAKMVGRPKASRAVGQALRSNPTPIVIPCHRVVNADGTLGGYGGRMGSERKIQLLKLEGAILT